MRPVICQGCRKKFVRVEGEYVKNNKGYYHLECFEETKKQKEIRTEILDYLEALTPGRVNYALVSKQLKTFVEDYGLTESGILGTLVFMHEVKPIKIMPEKGIAFVPYKYGEARQHYEKVYQMSKIKATQNTESTVVIYEPQTNKSKFLVDLDDIDFNEGEI